MKTQHRPPEESEDSQCSVFYSPQCRNDCGTVPKAKEKVTVGTFKSLNLCEKWGFTADTFMQLRFRSCTTFGGVNTPLNEKSSLGHMDVIWL